MASSLIWTCFLNDNRPAAKPKAKEKKDRLLTWPATDADFTIMWDSAAAVFWSVLFRDLKWLWLTTYSLRPILFPPSRTKRRSKLEDEQSEGQKAKNADAEAEAPTRCFRWGERRGWWRSSKRGDTTDAAEAVPPSQTGDDAQDMMAAGIEFLRFKNQQISRM